MKSLLLRFSLFVFVFTLEVRVKADEMPEGCLATTSSCAVRTKWSEKFTLELGETTVVLDQGTSVIRVSASEIRLVAGTVWVRSKKPFTVRSEFGSAQMSEGGEIWAARTDDRMTVSSIDGELSFAPRGAQEPLLLPVGLENWMGKVGREGSATIGVPTAIEIRGHLQRWARLYSGSKKSFEKEALAFRGRWVAATQQAAGLHKELYERKTASLREEEAKRAEKLRRAQAHDRELRELFRRKVFQE